MPFSTKSGCWLIFHVVAIHEGDIWFIYLFYPQHLWPVLTSQLLQQETHCVVLNSNSSYISFKQLHCTFHWNEYEAFRVANVHPVPELVVSPWSGQFKIWWNKKTEFLLSKLSKHGRKMAARRQLKYRRQSYLLLDGINRMLIGVY